MKPYYDDGKGIVLYHGSCEDVLPQLPRHDLLLTDPPYGIGASNNKRANKQHGKAVVPSKDYGYSNWDDAAAPQETLDEALTKTALAIIWGGNYFALSPQRGWLVWDKDNGSNGYADCELAWTNVDMAVRRLRYRWMGMLQENMADKEVRFHPTQKPVDLMRWCIGFTPPHTLSILDPFAGSGTTGRAAKDLGKRCTMIEREEKYCEIIVERMRQEVLL